ncbi:MAG: hypothetical protein UY77_C0002G0028 [Candidatus Uhrbacteria bacterium GW2011_GWA2_53_10]|uniref:DUF4012 domain-containing protein n=1 Tax=Candidatus Uhrbacteria bacterium GW2011_GWA2_53_10 TaxID=1618980 RepID=A0A0G1XQX4_9BACT|nr:MAG: hypothetical protein UY77_C0002G0028 [Candidatus Uhrbacteria bacterium GW2011_GWA2_53_10]
MEDSQRPARKSKPFLRTINAKTSGAKFGALLQRRRLARQIVETSLDTSIPTLFRARENSHTPLPIHTSPVSRLSPFVVHLDRVPEPSEILDQETVRHVRINFLEGRPVFQSETRPMNELELVPHEVSSQLMETIFEELQAAPWVLPRFHSFPFRFHFPAPPEVLVHNKLSARLSLPTLEAPSAPTNLLQSFDLPEHDEEEEAERVTWSLPHGFQKAIGFFVLLSFAFVLPLHAMRMVGELREASGEITRTSEGALSALSQGAQAALAQDSATASQAFKQANRRFSAAQDTVTSLGQTTELLLSVLPTTKTKYRSGRNLLKVGQSLATAGERLSEGFTALERQPSSTITTRLALLSTYARAALPALVEAENALENFDPATIPEEYRAKLEELRSTLPALRASLDEFLEFAEEAHALLGGDGTKRYLLVFQNNTELRPTGGFMGSFAEVSLSEGRVEHWNVPTGGTYDLQGSIREMSAAPQPLRLLKARWEFQDANWFPDFPTSARQMIDMFESSGGPTVDGVIALNATLLVQLLGVLGPVDMPDYGREITAANFLTETQKIVELEYDRKENKPKAFIGDLANVLLARASEGTTEDFFGMLDILNRSLAERDVQVYLREEALQRRVRSLGWSGEVRAADGDYLLVVHTNLGGGKTDGVMGETIDVDVAVENDGGITNTVTIARTHYGTPNSLFTGVNNVDYLRLYVPRGSELLSARGFSIPDRLLFEEADDAWGTDEDLVYAEQTHRTHAASQTDVYEEQGKTVFGNWVQTKPGMTSTVVFTYRLPFALQTASVSPTSFLEHVKKIAGLASTDRYTFTLQKQAGVLDRTTTLRLHLPDSLHTLWSSGDPAGSSFSNRTDHFFGALLEPGTLPHSL